MEYESLLGELGATLGFELKLSEQGTCGVLLDEDRINFEINDGRLFIIADLASSEGRDKDSVQLLKAANLGLQTGFACIGIDEASGQFTLCRVLEGNLTFIDFEKILTLFVRAVRYWKKWLALPPSQTASVEEMQQFDPNEIRA